MSWRGGGILARFGTGVFYNLVGVLFNQGSTLVTNMLVANILGRSTFGQYAIVLSTLQSVSLFAGLGMGYTATRYLPELRVRDRPRAARILGLGSLSTVSSAALLSLLLFLGGPVIASGVLRAPQLALLLQIGAGVVFCTALTGYFTGVLAALERYDFVARGGIVSGITYTAACVLGALWFGLAGAVTGLLVSAAIQALVYGVLYRLALRRAELAPSYRGLGSERTVITRFVIPALCSGLTGLPALWLAQVALARHGTFGELGKYSAAFSLAMIVLFLPNVAYSVGMSLINHARGTGNARDYRSVFWTNMQFTVVVVPIGILGMALLGPFLLDAYGTGFRAAMPALLVLLAATLPEALTIAMFQLIQTNDRIWEAVLAINVPRDILIPTLAFALAPTHGALGVAIAYLAGRLLAVVISALLCWRIGLTLAPGSQAPDQLAGATHS